MSASFIYHSQVSNVFTVFVFFFYILISLLIGVNCNLLVFVKTDSLIDFNKWYSEDLCHMANILALMLFLKNATAHFKSFVLYEINHN